ncbi:MULTISPECIES: ATP-binding cassette domain-containing protein [unclassified Janthinobacterium]|uniref:ATP-binding cassette domain-containing protein n=1 Tax=unclassified Janthinobacterium TaxID=2610881 RepID=UPI001E4FDA6A|nr:MULTISPECIES: ATP-binding cassette domain-containing protein [unclassified Janthinobacterium]MCC7644019.1 ATP-binding cassette domain-containing protein [Janthinobacterium sp. EB271-G4-3-1]MCC7692112.1 ATP-binding cassette domain-containing protein [Janthinobacterium sp. EB271-G4-3-2]
MLLAPIQIETDFLSHFVQYDPASAPPQAKAAPQAPLARRGVPLELTQLSKSYTSRPVLKNVDLQLEAGEFVAIVGRSGCGKSTLLRAIAGLESADDGKVAIGSGVGAPDIRIMFQESRLLPWKTVLDNVALGLPRSVGAAAASLWTVGLAERADDWPSALSGGQKQRVALARALVHEPQLLLLDEPLGALDALTRIEMQQLIESLWLARGFTAVLVTHDVAEAVALADRVLLIEEGQITMDVPVHLPRPRQRGHAAFAALEQAILSRVLQPSLPGQ